MMGFECDINCYYSSPLETSYTQEINLVQLPPGVALLYLVLDSNVGLENNRGVRRYEQEL